MKALEGISPSQVCIKGHRAVSQPQVSTGGLKENITTSCQHERPQREYHHVRSALKALEQFPKVGTRGLRGNITTNIGSSLKTPGQYHHDPRSVIKTSGRYLHLRSALKVLEAISPPQVNRKGLGGNITTLGQYGRSQISSEKPQGSISTFGEE